MIVYALRCDSGHGFDAWFKDAAAYDALAAAGEVACPDCGSTGVAKAPMAPAIGGRAAARAEAARESLSRAARSGAALSEAALSEAVLSGEVLSGEVLPGGAPSDSAPGRAPDGAGDADGPRSGMPADPRARALAAVRQKLIALRRQVEATHEDVGERFAAEVRAIDAGAAEDRPIRGRATADEARDLIEDGLPVLPLPVVRSDS
jgi:hypothetical protein